MANIKISALPNAALPLDGPNSFFEVQTIEAGVEVSRKVASDDLTLNAAIMVEDEGVPLAGGADTLDFVGAGVVASGAGSTKTITIPGGGQVDSVVSGVNITIDATDPINPIANLDASITGVTVNGVVLNDGGAATSYLDETGAYSVPPSGGGQVDSVVGGTNISVNVAYPVNPIVNLDAAITGVSVDGVTLTTAGAATNYLDETGAYSVPPSGAPADPLIIGSINLTSALSTSSTGAPYDNVPINIGANLVGTQGMTQLSRQRIQTKPSAFSFNSTLFINTDGAGTSGSDTFIGGLNSANIEVEFGVAVRFQHGTAATVVAETTTPAAGGFLANNLATGAGLERVLTTADLGGAPVTQLEDGAANPATVAEGLGITAIRSVGNIDGEGREVEWQNQNGTTRASLGTEFFTDFIMRNHLVGGSLIFRVGTGGGSRIRAHMSGDAAIGGFSAYAGTSAVPRLQTLNHGVEVGNGTLFLVEQAAQEADIVGQGQLWVDSADDSLKYVTEAGVVFNLTAPATSFPIQAADNDEIQFGTGNDYQMFFNAANFEWNGPGAGSIIIVTGIDQFRVAGSLGINEAAAPDGNVAGIGQYWVRSSAPNRPTFTDDTDVDQLLDPSISEIVSVVASRTLVLEDKGKTIGFTGGTVAQTMTIPASGSVAYQIGTVIAFDNSGSVSISIAITTDTLIFADNNGTGTRVLAAGGYAAAQKVGATTWKISGANIS